MATRSRPPSRARSPINQGELGPFLPPASPELGEISLERVIRLLWGLQSQVDRIERTLLEQAEVSQEVWTNVKNISQTVDIVKDGLAQLQSARAKPIGKAQPFLGAPAPIISTGAPRRNPLSLFNPYPSSSFPSGPAPAAPQGPPPAPVTAPALPPAPSTVKVDHPDAFKGKIGSEAKQWLTQMLAWVRLNQRQFPSDMEVLSFLLMNMTEAAGAWAHPHLDQLGSHRALIQTVDEFKTKFLAAFGDPDATRAAERKITSLTQTSTCAEYITKFRTLQMELDWNDAALRGQFAQGLHWEVQKQIATRERQPRTLRELQDAALIIDNALREEQASTRNRYRPTGHQNRSPFLRSNYVLEEERNRRRAEGLCVKCGKPGHKFAECWTGWKATPKEDKGKAKEAAKIGKDSEYQLGKEITPLFTIPIKPEKQAETLEVLIDSGATSSFLHPCTAELLRLPLIDLPTPRTVTMLDGSSPQAGKIWKKAVLTFTYDGKKMTETFLICNTGSHAAILGLKWLDAHNPEIDWNTRTLSFSHTPPEHVAIAKEEEADSNPLEGVPSKHYDIGIELTEEGPLNSPLYSMTNAKSATLKDWLRDELKAGKIRPSKSSISSPVMFVPKKDGSRCLVVDYCCLNNRTKKNVYPLPRPNDLMAQLRGAKVFTKLDLRWGYNNVRVKEGDEWKTAFRTKYGLYKSLVMTFGLTNAPAAFQHFMNELFKDLLDVCVIIYLDDILIYSKDDATHTQHVHEVLWRLMDNQLFYKGFSLDKLKIQAVQEWPTPTKVKEVQLFLDVPWRWDTREQEAFQGLKDAITNAPVLCHADPSKPYFLETDASGAALGSILSQRQEDGRLHPLGFLSESFKGAEQNYNTHNKELLAIICSFEYWRIFLEGTAHPITVFTDHRNLEYWKESRTFNRRHARWHLLLAGYNFQIVYRPGKQSGKPDALSRQLDHANIPPVDQTMLPNPVFANVALVTPEKELQRQIEASLDQDKSLEEILQFLQNKSKAPPSIKQAFKDYQMEAGLLFYQGRIVVPDTGTLRTDLLRIFHDSPLAGHPGRQRTLELVSRNYYWPGIRTDTYWHVDSCETCQQIRKPNSELADLFLRHVWKKYGMPKKTVSDEERSSITTYHPQSDGQTERDWVKWLPMAEFAYNNAVHSSTGKSPFKALHGWEPSLTPSNVPTDVPEADDIASQMESQWREIEAALRQSKTRMTAGEAGEPISFEEGEEAWLTPGM
ncbi:hypothetical protein RHS01_04996 [Rhizoctonia solani]|uniref:RNA-directed DNA polymerase n=1 Tax=Rhizoctonia solani TaxID=456999 RepID=A0A8H7IEI5_9AGAM|nr:hypothetical protein RHS01_04996 [Rhizoctonia solani]